MKFLLCGGGMGGQDAAEQRCEIDRRDRLHRGMPKQLINKIGCAGREGLGAVCKLGRTGVSCLRKLIG